MASVVDICNLALANVGAQPISSLGDAVTTAVLCSTFYPLARDTLLEEADWKCVSTRASIAEDAIPPLWDFAHRYLIPSDCAGRVRQVADSTGAEVTRWDMELGYIVCDAESPIQIRYTSRVVDPVVFSSTMVEAIAFKLASLIAIPITENQALQQTLLKEYLRALEMAKAADGIRQSKEHIPLASPWPVDPTTGAMVDAEGKPLYIPDSVKAR
jgi:hypothetical protein